MDDAWGAGEQFTLCWREDSHRVTAYATRHVGPDRAGDVVADTFATAWRRWGDVPRPALPWLIGTARLIIANERRALRRRDGLDQRLRLLSGALAQPAADTAEAIFSREDALRRLARLSEGQREAILLAAWDGLSIADSAQVLGIRAAAVRSRIHRGRQQLERLENAPFTDVWPDHETPLLTPTRMRDEP